METIIPKGMLTKLSAALIAAAQTPSLIIDLVQAGSTFSAAVNAPLNVVTIIGAFGVIWGGIRRSRNYFSK